MVESIKRKPRSLEDLDKRIETIKNRIKQVRGKKGGDYSVMPATGEQRKEELLNELQAELQVLTEERNKKNSGSGKK